MLQLTAFFLQYFAILGQKLAGLHTLKHRDISIQKNHNIATIVIVSTFIVVVFVYFLNNSFKNSV